MVAGVGHPLLPANSCNGGSILAVSTAGSSHIVLVRLVVARERGGGRAEDFRAPSQVPLAPFCLFDRRYPSISFQNLFEGINCPTFRRPAGAAGEYRRRHSEPHWTLVVHGPVVGHMTPLTCSGECCIRCIHSLVAVGYRRPAVV